MVGDNPTKRAGFSVKIGRREAYFEAVVIRVGTGSACDVVLESKIRNQTFSDPVAAGEHCQVRFDGEGFLIQDVGSATGTFVNGVAVEQPVYLTEGAEIIVGVSRIIASPGEKDGQSVLTLELKANDFQIVMRNEKGELNSDPDLWARTELGLSLFVPLRLGNWAAVIVGVVLLPFVFVEAVKGPLIEPGPLCESHRELFEEDSASRAGSVTAAITEADFIWARAQGCQACHEPLNGTPLSKCTRCHGKLMLEHHPFKEGPDHDPDPRKVNREWGEPACNFCHKDHQGSDSRGGGFIPTIAQTQESCGNTCHRGTRLEREGLQPQREPVSESMDRIVTYSPFEFGHDDHVIDKKTGKVIDCRICHRVDAEVVAKAEQGNDDRGRKDYLPVAFEACEKCHMADRSKREKAMMDLWPQEGPADKGKYFWDVSWHGSDDASKCEQCHERVYSPERKTVERLDISVANFSGVKARYKLRRRTHQDHFAKFDGMCSECHRREKALLAGVESVSFFWHAAHMERGIFPQGREKTREVSVECEACHAGRKESVRLTPFLTGKGEFFNWTPDSCGECHKERVNPLQLQPEPLEKVVGASVKKEDFPHKHHLNFNKSGLGDGCFTCHEFQMQTGETPLAGIPTTKPEMRSCSNSGCHGKHDNVGGGFCQKCHAMRFPNEYNVYLGDDPASDRPLLTRPWPTANAFNHYSVGHKGEACVTCHDVGSKVKDVDLQLATSLSEIPVPHEGYATCRTCHVKKRQRFHWR